MGVTVEHCGYLFSNGVTLETVCVTCKGILGLSSGQAGHALKPIVLSQSFFKQLFDVRCRCVLVSEHDMNDLAHHCLVEELLLFEREPSRMSCHAVRVCQRAPFWLRGERVPDRSFGLADVARNPAARTAQVEQPLEVLYNIAGWQPVPVLFQMPQQLRSFGLLC